VIHSIVHARRLLLITALGLLSTVFAQVRPGGALMAQSARPVGAVTRSATGAVSSAPVAAPTDNPLQTPPPTLTRHITFSQTGTPNSDTPRLTFPPLAGAISPAEIYRKVAAAVAFIQVPSGTGSGLLMDNGFVLTNAHVVWPHSSARIVFGDGSEFLDVPLHSADSMVDLALLGPIDADLPSLPLGDGESSPIGSQVYLIGYPGEVEKFPQPALASGLISRMREWHTFGISYFQTDAAIAGGQSGGVLLSAAGEVIGITGFSFADGAFGLAASTADLAERVALLAAGEDTDGLATRKLTERGSRLRHSYTPEHAHDQRMYLIQEPIGSEIEVRTSSKSDQFFYVVDIFGEYAVFSDETGSGQEKDSFTVELDAPYFLVVGPVDDPDGAVIDVRGSRRLHPFVDPDDHSPIKVGSQITGQIDYAGDVDVFRLQLAALDEVTLTVDSVAIDPYISIERLGAVSSNDGISDGISDDDSGGGLFGVNASLVFTAPRKGEYLVVVEDSSQYDVGGYVLHVERGR
jgi:S1-C subfamily serine protease